MASTPRYTDREILCIHVTYIHIHTYVYMYTYISVRARAHTHTHTHTHTHNYIYIGSTRDTVQQALAAVSKVLGSSQRKI